MLYDYDKITLEKIQGLPQGFYLSYDKEKNVVLTLKVLPGEVSSIVKGIPITLYLIKNEKLITLYILDHPEMPFFFKGMKFSRQDNEYKNFEEVVIDLIKAESFKLVVMNETHYQIINSKISKENSINLFKEWLNNKEQVFEIVLSDSSFRTDNNPMYIDSFKNQIWDNNLIDNKPYFKFDEYTKDGKHGYHQEFSLRNILSQYYEPNKELFHSVKKSTGEEFTDFVIIYEKTLVLIESKYTVSTKQTMFNKAISKAVKQLDTAEKTVLDHPELIDNSALSEQLPNFDTLLKMCIFYNDGRVLSNAFSNISQNHDPQALPLFITISTFYQFASYIQIQNENYRYLIIQNLLKIREEYFKKNKIVIIDSFDINTGAIGLLR
ncbi:hypothetical protein [Flavobacterium poyangense]|uniref:hypothetical protein n=1 Tax=Flavobacterium poyangense TaxID=2204302 RepID=UPI0014208F41|nr:hypothetical protein [Flavobacterium sp. JXAS1]